MDIYDIASFINVKDLLPGDGDFRYRYWGTALVKVLGYDVSGRLASAY